MLTTHIMYENVFLSLSKLYENLQENDEKLSSEINGEPMDNKFIFVKNVRIKCCVVNLLVIKRLQVQHNYNCTYF